MEYPLNPVKDEKPAAVKRKQVLPSFTALTGNTWSIFILSVRSKPHVKSKLLSELHLRK
jgi:hypothetical protein